MKKNITLLFILLFVSTLSAQTPAKYWVKFKDKANSVYSVSRPEEFLSPRAIEKRTRFGIPIDETDLPVNRSYIDRLLSIDTGMVLLTRSKWLNGVTVYSTTTDIEQKISALPFVTFCECTITLKDEENFNYPKYSYLPPKKTTEVIKIEQGKDLDYGVAVKQTTINNVHWLHRMGAHGEGMLMAVFDAGFDNVDEISHFEALREEGRLLGTRSFVFPGRTVFNNASHGTEVLSCITGYKPGEMIGTAPKASFYLAQTEDSRSENKIEEDNWVAALEWADSLGCDVVNSSLGYHNFDNAGQSYKYEDMNGRVSRCSQAASMAAGKGIIVCVSAGNEGTNKWHHITTPADATDIITVGGISLEGTPAEFSSYGPTSDNRIKPDAAAVGAFAIVANPQDETTFSFGTSFSSPLLSGMVCCLWQLFPEKTPVEIINAVKLAGNQYTKPTDHLGYGITDFLFAYDILKLTDAQWVSVLPTLIVDKNVAKIYYSVIQPSKNFTVSCKLDGSPKTFTKKISPKKNDGDNRWVGTARVKLPKLHKEQSYGIVRMEITDDNTGYSYEIVIGKIK